MDIKVNDRVRLISTGAVGTVQSINGDAVAVKLDQGFVVMTTLDDLVKI